MAGLKVLKNVELSCTNVDCSWPLIARKRKREGSQHEACGGVNCEASKSDSSPALCWRPNRSVF